MFRKKRLKESRKLLIKKIEGLETASKRFSKREPIDPSPNTQTTSNGYLMKQMRAILREKDVEILLTKEPKKILDFASRQLKSCTEIILRSQSSSVMEVGCFAFIYYLKIFEIFLRRKYSFERFVAIDFDFAAKFGLFLTKDKLQVVADENLGGILFKNLAYKVYFVARILDSDGPDSGPRSHQIAQRYPGYTLKTIFDSKSFDFRNFKKSKFFTVKVPKRPRGHQTPPKEPQLVTFRENCSKFFSKMSKFKRTNFFKFLYQGIRKKRFSYITKDLVCITNCVGSHRTLESRIFQIRSKKVVKSQKRDLRLRIRKLNLRNVKLDALSLFEGEKELVNFWGSAQDAPKRDFFNNQNLALEVNEQYYEVAVASEKVVYRFMSGFHGFDIKLQITKLEFNVVN